VNPWVQDLVYLVLGVLALGKGAHWLVDGGASLARHWGVSPLLVGLTVVAWGTSLPEVVVSGLAAWRGMPASALGNVLGSNVANVGLVLGVTSLILPVVLLGRVKPREIIWLLGSLGVLWAVCYDRDLTRLDAGILLCCFVIYNLILFRSPGGSESSDSASEGESHSSKLPWLAVIAGSLAIAVGAHCVMEGAGSIAKRVGMADSVLGLTILALGTSLPELFTGVSSALKGHAEIGFGNVIGSNVFNSLAVMGVAGMVRPFGDTEQTTADLAAALQRDFPAVLVFSAVLVMLPFLFRNTAGRLAGSLMLAGYLGFLALVMIQG
jgi:cation:H+ antiporter